MYASNRVLYIEDMTEAELKVLNKFYSQLNHLSERDGNFVAAHSVDEAKKIEVLKWFNKWNVPFTF